MLLMYVLSYLFGIEKMQVKEGLKGFGFESLKKGHEIVFLIHIGLIYVVLITSSRL